MSNVDITRAWKDEEYRNSLTEEQKSHLPPNPAGIVDLTEIEQGVVEGGALSLGSRYIVPFTIKPHATCPRGTRCPAECFV